MNNLTTDGQPEKTNAEDLSYLYDFICQCPQPEISQAVKRLVAGWLNNPVESPKFAERFKQQLKMTDDELIQIGWLLAINPLTPPMVLADLCTGAPAGLLERIAHNTNTGASTLAQLSYQAVAQIRIATAGNPATPLASLMLLVQDENPAVRFSIAENASIPVEALEALTRDDNPYIKMRAEVTMLRTDVERNVFAKTKLDNNASI